MKAHIHVPVSDLAMSLAFFLSLEYRVLQESDEHAFITDGCIVLHLNARNVPAGYVFYVSDLKEQLSKLKDSGVSCRLSLDEDSAYREILIEAPDKAVLRFLQMADEPHLDEVAPTSICGTHYGIGIMAEDFVGSIEFWEKLGFKLTSGTKESKSYVEMSNGTIPLGIYRVGSCPHTFVNPSLTYFEKDMADRIAKAKSAGITFVEEITQFNENGIVDHAIWKSPSGLHAFMFCC